MASLFTGLYPESHGVAHGLVQKGEIFGQEVLSDEHQLLAEHLKQAGYRTFGITASLHLAGEFGFSQGFDRYENVGFASADKVFPVLEALKKEILVGEGPYFLWLHLFDPHDPYHPRGPWIERNFPELEAATELGLLSPLKLRRYRRQHRGADDEQIDDVLELAHAAYDSEVNYADRAVQSVFETLGVSPEDLIVITSDHGEEFLEHRDFGHAGTLYEEQVRIPLIVRLPAKAHAGKVIQEPMSILDILPSLLDWLHIDQPEALHGQSFLASLEGTALPPRPIYLSLSRSQTDLSGVMVEDWKYIHDDGKRARHKLFDLSSDPEERINLVGREPARTGELARQLSNHLAKAESQRLATTLEDVPPETVEQMRALGYVD
jgi:arylsulfatase A-like enzyme